MAKKARAVVPKRIAGIRIPRKLRKGPIGAFFASSGGQVLIAEVLLVLAGVVATAANPATRTGRDLRNAVKEGAQAMYSGGGKGGKKRARQRAALVGIAVERALEAFQGAISGAVERPNAIAAEIRSRPDRASRTTVVEDATAGADVAKKKRSSSSRRVRR
jgi:hypothetical protein